MQKRITISIDSKLLDYTAEHFGYKNTNENYSELVEKALLYIVKPQFYFSQQLVVENENSKQLFLDIEESEQQIKNGLVFSHEQVKGTPKN